MTEGTYFLHYRNMPNGVIDPRGGVTVAIRRMNDRVLAVAKSRCGKKDVFNRKLGRQIAEGRLNHFLNATDGEFPHVAMIPMDVTDTTPVKTVVDDHLHPEMDKLGYY